MNYLDGLVTDPALLPKKLAKSYSDRFKEMLGKKTKVRVVESRTTAPPRGWDYGNITILELTLPNGLGLAIQLQLLVVGETLQMPPQVSATAQVDRDYGGLLAARRGKTAQEAINGLMSEISGHLFALGSLKK